MSGLTASNVKNWAVFVLGSLRVSKFMKACKVLAPLPLPSPKTHPFPLFHTKISWRSSLKDDVLTQGNPSPQCNTLEVSCRVSQRVAFQGDRSETLLLWQLPPLREPLLCWIPTHEISGLVPKGHHQPRWWISKDIHQEGISSPCPSRVACTGSCLYCSETAHWIEFQEKSFYFVLFPFPFFFPPPRQETPWEHQHLAFSLLH